VILIVYTNNDIAENEELLTQFYPNVIANISTVINNDESKLQKMVKKNSNLLKLIHTFDMLEE
jgi:hypothetical protein